MSTSSPPGPDELPYRGMMPALANPGEAPILWASLDGIRQNTFEYHEQTAAAQAVPTDEPDPEPDAPEGLDALVAGLTLHEPQRNGDADRVVAESETCDCGRPAGADGLCEYHRREHAGETIGNHGGRL